MAAALMAVCTIHAQNIGINILNPTRARLEVIGVEGGGNTSGIFGLHGAGISVQQNPPAIGFNQYRDISVAGYTGKYMTNGYAAQQYLDPATGVFVIEMFPAGIRNNHTPEGFKALTFMPNGNTGIKTTSANAFASLTVLKGGATDATANIKGSTHSTMFNYGGNDDTYIRPGIDSSTVNLCTQNGGDLLIGGGQSKLYFNRLLPSSGTTSPVELEQTAYNDRTNHTFAQYDATGKCWGHYLEYNLGSASAGNPGYNLCFAYGNLERTLITWMDGTLYSRSDSRLKTRIQPLEPVMKKLTLLNPVSYAMKYQNPENRRSLGFIAQEVRKIFPGSVRVISNHNPKGRVTPDLHTLTSADFSVYTIKALQEQWQQIQELEAEQSRLEKELDALMNQASRAHKRTETLHQSN